MTNFSTASPPTSFPLGSLAAPDYLELRRIAGSLLRYENPANLMDSSDLLHDALLRLLKSRASVQFNSWDHFRRTAVASMRRTLVDQGRARSARKRVCSATDRTDLAAYSASKMTFDFSHKLLTLERYGGRLQQVAEMKLVLGFKICEIAATLGVSSRTIRRDWKRACQVLGAEMMYNSTECPAKKFVIEPARFTEIAA